MFLEGDRLLKFAGWTRQEQRAARRHVSIFLTEHVFSRLGAYGSRVGRMQIVLEFMAERLVRVSCRDVAVLVLQDVIEKTRNGPIIYSEE